MADDDQQKTPRTPADKERSRQRSRAVSGKEAARGVTGKPGQGQRGPAASTPTKGAKGPQRGGAPGRGGPGRPPPRGAARASAGARKPPSSRTALYTWGAIGLVIVLVVVLIVVKALGSSKTTKTGFKSEKLSSTLAHQVTSVPESVFDKVGITSSTIQVGAPRVIAKQPAFTIDGKPGVFYMGGEFCPYCAAQRWSIAAALSRFGTFKNLYTMLSSNTDIYPDTATLTFANAKYTSPYIDAWLVEIYTRTHTSLTKLTATQTKVATKYDRGKYTGTTTTSSGSIPFIDVGNKVFSAGSSFVPSALEGISRTDIGAGLDNATNPVTQAIISSANYMSASICSIDGSKPATVCTGKGVTSAAKALGLKL